MINELEIIDYLALDEADESKLLLAITDHLDWQYKKEHLLLLQEKINNYVKYILNEQYKEVYEDKINSFQILIFLMYQPPRKFEKLLPYFDELLKKKFPEIQIEITYQLLDTEDE